MTLPFAVKPATELFEAEFVARWRDRQALHSTARAVLRTILHEFVEAGGPVPIERVARRTPGVAAPQLRDAIAELDENDLIVVQDRHVTLAYPFATGPTAFQVALGDGRSRYAVCAIDALAIPAILDQPVTIRSRCHACGAGIEIDIGPGGPPEISDVVVWVGKRGDRRQRACASICRALNFFCSLDHLRRWWESSPAPGAAAVLDEAAALGRRVFGDLLRGLG